MIRINQMKLDIEHTKEDLEKKVLKTLRIKRDELLELQIRKQSVDARKKPELYYVYSVDVQVKDEAKVRKNVKNKQVQFQVKPNIYHFPDSGEVVLEHRPVIIGTGPAGMFCGYMLAMHGYRPILLERGSRCRGTYQRCGNILEDRSIKSCIKCTVWRRRGWNIFGWKTEYARKRQRRPWKRSYADFYQTWGSGEDYVSE